MPSKSGRQEVPEPTIRRLPLYLGIIKDLHSASQKTVSCTDLAKELQLDPTQVRKDIASTGIAGTARVGFQIEALIDHIEEFLGWDHCNAAVLIGAGNLGEALLKYKKFEEYGFAVTRVFDQDKRVFGKSFGDIEVCDVMGLEESLLKLPVPFGIIAVPAEEAQKVADVLIRSGIKGIWNFAPTVLKTPRSVFVENVCLSTSLAVLTKNVNDKQRREEVAPPIEVEICMGSSCFARGNKSALDLVQDYIDKNNLRDVVAIKGALCKGKCKEGPILSINEKEYANIDAIAFLDELKEHVRKETE